MSGYTRRRLLAGGAAGFVAVAGCASAAPETEETPPSGPFVVRNRGEDEHLISLTLRRADEVLLDRSYDLASGGRQELGTPVDEPGRYDLSVELGTGTTDDASWTLAECERVKHVVVVVTRPDTVEIETERETVEPSSCE